MLNEEDRKVLPLASPKESARLEVGQKVRVKATSWASSTWKIPMGSEGTVLCRYRILRDKQTAPDRLDVSFGSKVVIWGASDREFEVVR